MDKRFVLTAVGTSAAAISCASHADITVTFDEISLLGAEGISEALGDISGTLTGITYTYTWANNTGDSSWASDTMFGISINDSYGISIGGYNLSMSDISGVVNSSWGYGGGIAGSPDNGTYSGSISLSVASFSGIGTAWMANGWNGSGGSTLSGTLTFQGLVPAPGALALLGLAGTAGIQRRRK